MEIQKIFSSFNGERLFSVLMSEEDISLFSNYLEQREYVSKRVAKKKAKKILEAEQEFQNAVNSGANAEVAHDIYKKKVNGVMNQKDAHKILTVNPNDTVKINPIKNDRAAEQIAGAIGNGNQEIKEQISNQLKKSKGGKGVDVSSHIAAGKYNPEGVKQNVVNTTNQIKNRRVEQNSSRKQINDLNKQLEQQKIAQEARERKLKAQHEREIQNIENRQIRTNSRPQPVPNNKPLVNTNTVVSPKPSPVTTQVENIAKKGKEKAKGEFMNLLKKHKTPLLVGGSLAAAGGIGYGIHKYRQNKNK